MTTYIAHLAEWSVSEIRYLQFQSSQRQFSFTTIIRSEKAKNKYSSFQKLPTSGWSSIERLFTIVNFKALRILDMPISIATVK